MVIVNSCTIYYFFKPNYEFYLLGIVLPIGEFVVISIGYQSITKESKNLFIIFLVLSVLMIIGQLIVGLENVVINSDGGDLKMSDGTDLSFKHITFITVTLMFVFKKIVSILCNYYGIKHIRHHWNTDL